MTKTRPNYTKQERAAFVALLIANGYPYRRGAIRYTQDRTGIHNSHLKKWFLDVPHFIGFENLEMELVKLEQLVSKEVEEIFDEMNRKRENANYKDLGVINGILLDKLIALSGGVNNRTETITSSWQEIVKQAKEGKL